jgi:hypothetical protein
LCSCILYLFVLPPYLFIYSFTHAFSLLHLLSMLTIHFTDHDPETLKGQVFGQVSQLYVADPGFEPKLHLFCGALG